MTQVTIRRLIGFGNLLRSLQGWQWAVSIIFGVFGLGSFNALLESLTELSLASKIPLGLGLFGVLTLLSAAIFGKLREVNRLPLVPDPTEGLLLSKEKAEDRFEARMIHFSDFVLTSKAERTLNVTVSLTLKINDPPYLMKGRSSLTLLYPQRHSWVKKLGAADTPIQIGSNETWRGDLLFLLRPMEALRAGLPEHLASEGHYLTLTGVVDQRTIKVPVMVVCCLF